MSAIIGPRRAILTKRSTYKGPGDLKAAAFAWWGLRGYSAAYSNGNNPAIDLVDQSGANQITINIKSNGSLDTATIVAWIAANSVTAPKVKKWYDQSGHGYHLTQATLANMPDFLLQWPGVGGGKPCLQTTSANSQTMTSPATGLNSGTGTWSFVAERYANLAAYNGIMQAGGNCGVAWSGSANSAFMSVGNSASVPMYDTTPHTGNFIFNGSSSYGVVDGGNASTVYSITPSVNFQSPFKLGNLNNAFPASMRISEIGYWNAIWTVADAQAMDINQNKYWWSGPTYEGHVGSRCRTNVANYGKDDTTTVT